MGFFGTIGYYICIPFAALLRLFYNLTGSYGIAIILFTLVIKLILLPFQMKSKKSMIRMSKMSGRMQEIQKKYANNQAKMNEEIQKLYQDEGVSPMSGCLWSFLPLPIMLALYSIIREPITHFMMLSKETLYAIVDKVAAAGVDMSSIVKMMTDGAMDLSSSGLPQLLPYGQINLVREINSLPELSSGIDGWFNVNYHFLGMDLTSTPMDAIKTVASVGISAALVGLILLPIISGGLSFLLSKVTMSQSGANMEGSVAATNKMMIWMMPLFSIYIGFILPAALGVYWIAQSVLSIIQEIILGKFYMNKLEAEEAARAAARQADRQKRIEEGRVQQEKQRQQPAVKMTLKEKQKAAQEAKANKKKISTNEAGRVGDRPYARGRAYREDRDASEN